MRRRLHIILVDILFTVILLATLIGVHYGIF